MAGRVRKPIKDMVAEMRDWFSNMDRGSPYIELVQRVLASVPGGEEIEDLGVEPISDMGWHEFDLLGRMIDVIKDKQDVQDLVSGLLAEEDPY